jgi:V8-like Glu-specific endopeptidase
MPFTQYPLDTVVYITDTIGRQEFQGSGVLISKDEVLTASHVVYSEGVGTATNIEVTPAYDGVATGAGQVSPYGSASGITIHYNAVQDASDAISGEQSQYDYAVIHLNTSFASLGTMGLEANFPSGAASVTGYPATAGGNQITRAETVVPDPSYTLYDGTGLGPGSSGGPVWIESGRNPYVVGVVSSGDNQTDEGYFTQITTQAYDTIEGWVATDDPPCFLQGTRIATMRGDVPVEAMTTDDLVLACVGGPVRVKWLGRRRVDCRRHPRPQDVMPVRIAAHAFGPDQPRRDLWLSPDHALHMRGALIPVRYLLNGATIVQEHHDTAIYWHVELLRHDVLLAENLPAESYLDTGNRGAFENGGGTMMLHPDFARTAWEAGGCAPLLLRGPRLAAARRRLAVRAAALGHRMTDDPGLALFAGDRPVRATAEGAVRRLPLPAGTATLRLASRIRIPAHDDAGHDTRRLGIAVSRLWLEGREVALDSPGFGAGWHAPEPAWRWTDGHAALAVSGAREVAFEIAMSGKYWLTANAPSVRKTA